MEMLESITFSKGERAPFSQLDSNFSFGNNIGNSLTHFRTPNQPASVSFLFDIGCSAVFIQDRLYSAFNHCSFLRPIEILSIIASLKIIASG
jgi:hypothetical protein